MGSKKDYKGNKFGHWTVLERTQMRPAKYLCRCKCGIEKKLFLSNLTSRKSTQCLKCAARKEAESCIGKKFFYCTVMSLEKNSSKHACMVNVRCDCGNEVLLELCRLRKGILKSCGKCNLNRKIRIFKSSKIGELFIVNKLPNSSFNCICSCGKKIIKKRYHLLTQHPSCGCFRKNINIENAKKIIGTKIGNLKIIKFIGMRGKPKKTRSFYLCKCKCGNLVEKSISYLYGSASCGCLQQENAAKGQNHPHSKLSENDVKAMKGLFSSHSYSKRELSLMFGISESTAGNILNKKTWKHNN